MTGWRSWGYVGERVVPPDGERRYKFRWRPDAYHRLWSASEVAATCPRVPDDGVRVCRFGNRVPCGRNCGAAIFAYPSWAALQRSIYKTGMPAGGRFSGRLELLGDVVVVPDRRPKSRLLELQAQRVRVEYVVALRPDAPVVERIAAAWNVPLVILDEIDPEQEPQPRDVAGSVRA